MTVSDPTVDADVVNSLERSLTADEERVLPAWRAQAWTVLKAEVPTLEARLAAATIDVETVKQVLIAMVDRKLRNPDGLRSYGVDDGTATVDQALSSGQIAPTPAEIARLSPRVPGAALGTGIFSIQVSR
jgi:hypothetical protein